MRSSIIPVLVLCAACGESERVSQSSAAVAQPDRSQNTRENWAARYTLRGTIEGNRQASGTLVIEPLTDGDSLYADARARVRRRYPAYAGPLYVARLALEQEPPSTITFTCAHGPAARPPLVCEPRSPVPRLEQAALVVRPDGTALLTGSHGEGVTIDYGRFTWTEGSD